MLNFGLGCPSPLKNEILELCFIFSRASVLGTHFNRNNFRGWGMGPLLVLVSPCFRETVVVTCKIGSFLCSLDTFLQKNVIAFFFGNLFSKWRSFEKGLFLAYFSHFSVTRERLQKSLQHVSHSHAYTYFAHTIAFFFCLTNFEKKNTNLSGIRFLFGVIPGVDSYSHHWNNLKITKWWAKLKLECLLLICIYNYAKFIVICKPQTLNDGGEDSVKYKNRKKKKKQCF